MAWGCSDSWVSGCEGRAPQADGFVAEAKAAFARHLNGAEPTGPLTLIFHGIVDHESDGPLEVYVAEPAGIGPGEKVCDIAFPLG